ncbi:pre-mRNA-splicing factor syf1, partial [Coemansia helicoidea]
MELDIGEEDLRFEEEVLQAPYRLKGWLRYIEHRREGPARALTIVYERAVAKLPGSYKLWNGYLRHRVGLVRDKNPVRHEEEMRKTRLCFERALLALHKMPVLWLMYARFLGRQPDVTQARRCFDRALRALPVTQHAAVWAEYLRFARRVGGVTAERVFRRYLQLWPDQAEQYVDWCVEKGNWRMAAAQLIKLLDDPGFKSPRATSSPYRLWRQLAQIIRHHPDVGLDVEPVLRDGIARFGEQAGELWTALANFFIVRGHIERARDVFEEAVGSVSTVRDFALVFDAYAEMEEASIAGAMEDEVQQSAGEGAGDARRRQLQLDLRLLQLERLMDRRPVLVSDIMLRQNANDVDAWLRRAELWRARADDVAQDETERARAADLVVETYEDAVRRVD